MKTIITGAAGQLGRALAARFADQPLLALGRGQLDVGNREAVLALEGEAPTLILHAAAMTDVDGCERDPEAAYRANAIGTQNVALLAQQTGAALVVVSTDYVYDGTKGSAYWEGDVTHPLSIYAASKLAGEQAAERLISRLYIVRTAWLYGPGGSNFPSKILALSEMRPRLSIVTRELGHPTYAPHLADAIYRLVQTGAFGLYHLVNEGCVSRYDFARAILDGAGKRDYPLDPTDSFPRAATPPAHVELSTYLARQAGAGLPVWGVGLEEWIRAERASRD